MLIKIHKIGELFELDHEDLVDLQTNFVLPYVLNKEFRFDGYLIKPSDIQRLVISQTIINSSDCVVEAYEDLKGSNITTALNPQDCVFDNFLYSKNITEEVFSSVEALMIESTNPMNNKKIFLAYSYKQIDDEFVSGFKELLIDKNFDVLDGKADGLGSISQSIIDKIKISDIVVIIMTKRDKKENGRYTTAAWLLEEKGAALALNKQVGMFVEEEVDESDIGGMQGDNQRFHFTRNNFLKVAMSFIKIINK